MEAMDHMLRCFMTQNPTANELYFLLSVRAADSWGVGRAGMLSQRGPSTGCKTWPAGFLCLEV